MRRGQLGIGSIIALSMTALLGGMMLIPAPEADSRVDQSSSLATSSSLTRYLNDSIDRPNTTGLSDATVTEVAALTEPAPAPLVAKPQPLSTSATSISAASPKPIIPTPTPTQVAVTAAVPETPAASPAPIDLSKAERIAVRTPVNLRVGPSTDQSTVTVLPAREEVAILERSGSWARIARADGTIGWVYASYLGDAPAPAGEPATREAAAKPRPAADDGPQLASLKLRAEPSSRARSITVLEPGTPLKVAERRPGWVRVIMPDGLTGWVRTTN